MNYTYTIIDSDAVSNLQLHAFLDEYGDFECINTTTNPTDGLNDIFMVSGTSYEFISMQIFNRWGQEIFSDFSGRGWDGRLPSGLRAKTGSYNFILEIQPLTRPISNSVIYKGNLELFNN